MSYPYAHKTPTAPQLVTIIDMVSDGRFHGVEELTAAYIMQPTARFADLKRHGYIIRRRKRFRYDLRGNKLTPARTDFRLQPAGEGNHDFADVMTCDSEAIAHQRRNVPSGEEDLV